MNDLHKDFDPIGNFNKAIETNMLIICQALDIDPNAMTMMELGQHAKSTDSLIGRWYDEVTQKFVLVFRIPSPNDHNQLEYPEITLDSNQFAGFSGGYEMEYPQ